MPEQLYMSKIPNYNNVAQYWNDHYYVTRRSLELTATEFVKRIRPKSIGVMYSIVKINSKEDCDKIENIIALWMLSYPILHEVTCTFHMGDQNCIECDFLTQAGAGQRKILSTSLRIALRDYCRPCIYCLYSKDGLECPRYKTDFKCLVEQ